MDNVINVRRRDTDRIYQCVPQIVNLNLDDRYVLRYNIGINGYTEWSFIEAIYDNDEFNKRYEVVRWDSINQKWVPERS